MADNKNKKGLLVLAAIVIAAVAMLAGSRWWGQRQKDAEIEALVDGFIAATEPLEVHYLVDGTADGADVTMTTPSGVEQESVIVLPLGFGEGGGAGRWFEFSPGDTLGVSAQNTGATGTVMCRISIKRGPGDFEIVAENESSGPYAVVSCDAIVN